MRLVYLGSKGRAGSLGREKAWLGEGILHVSGFPLRLHSACMQAQNVASI